MNLLWFTTVVALLLYSLNLTIPIWISTLTGYGSFIVVMDSVFGKVEQYSDVVVGTTVTILAVITIIQMMRKGLI